MDILTNFGERIAELILENNLTPESFSENVNIDRSVIYKYLRKECLPSMKNLIVIADRFGYSTDFLLGLKSNDGLNLNFKCAPPFDESFKKILGENKLSRYRFRTKNKFAKQSIDDWFNGKREPSVDNLVKIADYFECTVDYLLGRE